MLCNWTNIWRNKIFRSCSTHFSFFFSFIITSKFNVNEILRKEKMRNLPRTEGTYIFHGFDVGKLGRHTFIHQSFQNVYLVKQISCSKLDETRGEECLHLPRWSATTLSPRGSFFKAQRNHLARLCSVETWQIAFFLKETSSLRVGMLPPSFPILVLFFDPFTCGEWILLNRMKKKLPRYVPFISHSTHFKRSKSLIQTYKNSSTQALFVFLRQSQIS